MMLTTYGNLARFIDGIGVSFGQNFLYLKDACGKERIGLSFITDEYGKNGQPAVVIDDVVSGRTLVFEGDGFKRYPSARYFSSSNRKFACFSSIQEAGMLHDGFDNDIQRAGIMRDEYRGMIFGDILSEVAKIRGLPVGEEAQRRLRKDMEFPALLYAFSLELLYAGINGNRDVLLLVDPPHEVSGNRVTTLNAEGINLDGNLQGFLDANPRLKARLTDGKVGESGRYFDTSEKILDRLRQDIPEEVLEAGYQRFRAEIDGKQRLNAIREAHPREMLIEQAKVVDTKNPFRIGLAYEDACIGVLDSAE